MSPNEAVLLALFAVPVLLLMGLRANATLVFLSLCLGYVVMQFLGGEAQTFAQLFMTHATISANIMKLVLLLFPAVFTTLFMIRTQRGAKLAFNLLPAIATGFLAMVLTVPLLSPGLSHALTGLQLWSEVMKLQALVIGAGSLVSVLFLWLQRPQKSKDEGGKHH